MLSWCRIFSVFLRRNWFVGGFYVVICKLYTCWWLPISRICWIGYKLFFSWAEGYSCFKRSSAEFSAKSLLLKYFLNLINLFVRVVYRFSNRLGCHMPCESLNEFRETETHSRVCDNCHVSTFSDRGVTFKVILFQWNHLPKTSWIHWCKIQIWSAQCSLPNWLSILL